jgi:methionyl-tRNA formyltransferase
MRIAYFGTPQFSAAFLEFLVQQSPHQVVGVVTQPDKPSGRGMHLQAPPVKAMAEHLGLPVLQPAKLTDPEFLAALQAWGADCFVVIAFRLLPEAVLAIPRLGCMNLHGSLLPAFRGAAPVQWAVASGATRTGITLFRLDPLMDHGPVMVRRELSIGIDETAAELFDRMIPVGREALLEALAALERPDFVPLPQDHSQATPARRLRKEDGVIDWSWSRETIHARVRGFYPWPGGQSSLQGKLLRIVRTALPQSAVAPFPELPELDATGAPWRLGALFAVEGVRGGEPLRLFARAGDGWLELREVQPENRKAMAPEPFWNGLQVREGLVLA